MLKTRNENANSISVSRQKGELMEEVARVCHVPRLAYVKGRRLRNVNEI